MEEFWIPIVTNNFSYSVVFLLFQCVLVSFKWFNNSTILMRPFKMALEHFFAFFLFFSFLYVSSFQNFSSEMSAQLEFFFRTILDRSTFYQRNKFASLAEKKWNETNFLAFFFFFYLFRRVQISFLCVERNSFLLLGWSCQNKSLHKKLRLARVALLWW